MDLKVGCFLEGGVLDPEGRAQGTILLGIREVGRDHGGTPTISGQFLGCTDSHYRWWMREGEGRRVASQGWYHLCGERPGACAAIRGKAKIIHLVKVRELSPEDFTEGNFGFLKKVEERNAFDDALHDFNRKIAGDKRLPAPEPGVGPKATWGCESNSFDSRLSRSRRRDPSPTKKKLQERLEVLCHDLKKAEKDAADHKANRRKEKERARDKGGRRKEGKDNKERQGERKEKKRKEDHAGERGKEKKRGRSRSSLKGHRPKRSRSGSRKDPKRRRRSRSRRGSSDSSRDGKRTPLFHSRGSGGEGKQNTGDKRAFGEGPAIPYDDASETEDEAVFRQAPLKPAKSSQLRLLNYSNKYPGRLASRMLLKMQAQLARGLEGATDERTPPVAMNHVLTVMQPTLGSRLGVRTLREMKTLAQCLDFLSTGRRGRATGEGHWSSAQFLELLPPDNATLLERDEEWFLAQEYLQDRKIKEYDRGHPPKGGWDNQKGKGKGKETRKERKARARKRSRGRTRTSEG